MEGLTDFSELIVPGAGCEIPNTAERGISLEQLLRIARFILDHAAPDGTVIAGKNDRKTSTATEEEDSGEEFADEEAAGAVEELTVAEKGHSTQRVTVHTINLYHFVELVVKPATAARACSYVELVAFSAWEQRPEWFVSHWWGEPILYFVSCLQRYASIRGGRSVFWVCAYANSQHDLDSSIGTDPSQTSFRQALAICRGTVMILDMKATPFWRVWCAFEVEVTLCCPDKQLDLVTFVPTWLKKVERRPVPQFRNGTLIVDGAVQMISDGLVPEDCMLSAADIAMNKSPWTLKVQREKNFPIDILRRGMNVSIQHARSSKPEDRVRILNTIAGAKNLDKTPAKDHPSYHRVNATLRLRFAMTMLHRAVMMGDKDVFEKILTALSNASEQQDRVFDFPACDELTDAVVCQIVEHLPDHTRHLSFNMAQCKSLTSAAFVSLGEQLGRLDSLEKLAVVVAGCEQVNDDGVMALCEGLRKCSKTLTSLTLDFSWCAGLKEVGIQALAGALKYHKALKDLTLLMPRDGARYKYHVTDAAYAVLTASIGNLESLQHLTLHVAHKDTCDPTTMFVAHCIDGLPALKSLQLVVEGCVYSMSLEAFGASLGRLTKLTSLVLEFRGGLWSAQQEQMEDERSPVGDSSTKQPADAGLMSFAKGLQQLSKLVELKLVLQGFRAFGDAEACALATAIRKIKALRELHISMVGCELQDTGAQALANAIAKHVTLRRLGAHFSNCKGLRDASADALARCLFKLEQLTELHLSFTGTSIGNLGVKALSHNMSHVAAGLTDLTLFFSDLPDINDLAIADLGSCLLEFTQLRMLTVDVTKTGTTEGAVEELRQVLAGMCAWTEDGPVRWNEVGSGQCLAFLPERATQVNATTSPTLASKAAKEVEVHPQEKSLAKGKGSGKGKATGTTGFEIIPDERRAELEERVNAYVNSSPKAPLEFRPEELSPNERRLIHMMIEDVKGFITQSFGEGDDRYLVIFRDKGKLGRSHTANLERVAGAEYKPQPRQQKLALDLSAATLVAVAEERKEPGDDKAEGEKVCQNATLTTAHKRKLRKQRAKARRMDK